MKGSAAKYKPVPLQVETPDETLFRNTCKSAVVLGDSLHQFEVLITHTLRHSDRLSAVVARRLGVEAGISANHMDKLIAVARSQAGEWIHWIEGSASLDTVLVLIAAREAKQLKLAEVTTQ